MNSEPVILSSRVRLARNYEDLPFDLAQKSELAAMCVTRTANAMHVSPGSGAYTLLRLAEMEPVQRQSLCDYHLISADLLHTPDTAAVLLKNDETLSIMINEEDHLRIQSLEKGLGLAEAAERCFQVEDALSREVTFAFDEQLGYLTACPTNTGTGMRASLLVHLPMLTYGKQMGNVGQIVAKVGLTIRGVYGEGAEALGNLYMVSNQVTLGRTEQELISAVTAVGHQLTDLELSLREKTLTERRAYMEDTIYRAWGVLTNARLMSLTDFYHQWNGARLGAAMGLLPVSLEVLDALLDQVQDGALRSLRGGEALPEMGLPEARAELIRQALGE